jgi:hypothetical protein
MFEWSWERWTLFGLFCFALGRWAWQAVKRVKSKGGPG